MELRNLITFLQVVESGSFSKAAETLGYTQSTVSIQINQLESELGSRLFDRINHTVKITDQGILLSQYARRIIGEIQNIKEDFRSDEETEGSIHLVSSDSICEQMMKSNYLGFSARYPKIHMILSTADTDTMITALDHNEVDLIFTLDNHVYSTDYVIARESPVDVHFVTSASSPLASAGTLELKDLIQYPFLLTEHGMSYRKLLDKALAERSLQIVPALEAGRTDMLCSCVENGNGISFLPDFVTDKKVSEGKLVRLDVADCNLTIWKQLIYHKNKWLSKAIRTFIEFAVSDDSIW